MTLLVRDEVDIIRANIDFHLRHGVDFIVATDNGSKDGTREILTEYANSGVLTLIDEPGRDYSQARWVTRMAHVARDKHAADWILNNDADEFWHSNKGDLKQDLAQTTASMLICKRFNMFFPHDAPDPRNIFAGARWRIARPVPNIPLAKPLEDPLVAPYLYLDLPSKVLCRAAGLQNVEQGNHSASYPNASKAHSKAITIYHYPIRGFGHFLHKVTVGGAAYANNKELHENVGWHWRRWYSMVQSDRAVAAFQETMPSRAQLEPELRFGVVRCDFTMCSEGGLERRMVA